MPSLVELKRVKEIGIKTFFANMGKSFGATSDSWIHQHSLPVLIHLLHQMNTLANNVQRTEWNILLFLKLYLLVVRLC
jgi:hypothetical protein